MGTEVKSSNGDAYSALLDQYKNVQTTAYRSQGVTADDLTALKEKFDTFIKSQGGSSADLAAAQAAFDKNFGIMDDAVELKTSKGQTSNENWDSAREAMQSLLAEIAPEGSDEQVYDPTAGGGGQIGNSLIATGGQKLDTSGLDMGGVDDFIAQNPQAAPYLDMVKQASASYQPSTPVIVLLRQIQAESNFNPNAVGQRGEQGMTQFTPETWNATMGGGNPFDPQTAINAQAKYMAQLQNDNGGNLAWALEAYNGWERDKSYDYNLSKGCSPTYVQDSTGQPYDQRQDSVG